MNPVMDKLRTNYKGKLEVIATTVTVAAHEIPQEKEIGDFGILVYGGFSVERPKWTLPTRPFNYGSS
jgi:hypothetical protein